MDVVFHGLSMFIMVYHGLSRVYHGFHIGAPQECANAPGLRQLLHSSPGGWRSGGLGKSQYPPDQLQPRTDEDC